MEPENGPLEVWRFRAWKPSFSGSMLVFGGVVHRECSYQQSQGAESCEGAWYQAVLGVVDLGSPDFS